MTRRAVIAGSNHIGGASGALDARQSAAIRVLVERYLGGATRAVATAREAVEAVGRRDVALGAVEAFPEHRTVSVALGAFTPVHATYLVRGALFAFQCVEIEKLGHPALFYAEHVVQN